ncbi:MAG: hypothetical protein E7324_03135 [Clostridiales bacterium]|nr:hypothetical protein [Clostridiales bacterium]
MKKLILPLLIFLVSLPLMANGQETLLSPIVRYDFADASDLGKDSMGLMHLENIQKVAQGQYADGIHTAVFNGRNALAAKPITDQDVTDALPVFTITLWAKHPVTQSAHSFMAGTGVAYSTTGLGMGFYAGNDAYIIPLGGINGGEYASNYRFPYETRAYKAQDQWNLFVLSINGSDSYFSVNGEIYPVTKIPASGLEIANSGQVFTLGGIYNNDHTVFYNGFKGELADVRIYDCQLTQSQLKALRDNGIGGKDIPLAENQGYIVSAKANPGNLAIAKTARPAQALTALKDLSIALTLNDGSTVQNASVFWTEIHTAARGVSLRGRVAHPLYPNPKGVEITLDIPYGSVRTLQLPSIYSNGMVLQRNQPVRIAGAGGDPRDTILVSFAGQQVKAEIADNAWTAWLAPMPASKTPQTLEINYYVEGQDTPHQTFIINDVLVGEVWLGSGQSNMAYTLNEMIANPGVHPDFLQDYQQIDNWDMLRFYNYPYGEASDTLTNYSRMITWKSPDNVQEARSFSGLAVAYASHLQKMLGDDVPVGMINSSVGGSCIEEWLSKEVMSTLPSYAASMGKIDCRFYNAMIHPLKDYTIKGILWYQGEANCLWPQDYQRQFAAYAKMYRSLFADENLPIIVMQLPQYSETLYVTFRDAQWQLMEQVENTFVVCGIDLGDPTNIHPTDKYPFAARAAGVALDRVYQLPALDGAPYGLSPAIESIEETADGLLLTISNAKTLTCAAEDIKGFKILSGNRWQDAVIAVQGNQILVKCNPEETRSINYLRNTSFSGMDFIYNEYGLPLAPVSNRPLR